MYGIPVETDPPMYFDPDLIPFRLWSLGQRAEFILRRGATPDWIDLVVYDADRLRVVVHFAEMFYWHGLPGLEAYMTIGLELLAAAQNLAMRGGEVP